MTAETTDPKLRRNSLGLPELVFQGVTHIAPAANMVFNVDWDKPIASL